MKYLLILGLGILFIIGFFIGTKIEDRSATPVVVEEEATVIILPMKITSSAFEDNELIPAQYTCDGENIIPPLTFSDVPEETVSFALVMEDPDIPDSAKDSLGIEVLDHWIVFDIPAKTREIKEGVVPDGVQGLNTRGKNEYVGPCPPDKEHRYFFKLYALDDTVSLSPEADKEALEEEMAGHILDKAELVGRYEKQGE